MKKRYVKPVAVEEVFVANRYVAACTWNITSTASNNRMRCANPSHSDFQKDYFTSVWVAATNTTCQILVDENGIEKTQVINGDNFSPANGATVYGATGTPYTCTDTFKKGGRTYYVPAFVNASSGDNPCYGTYVNTGDYEEIMEKVFS